MTASLGPPPWPIPPSWQVGLPSPEPVAEASAQPPTDFPTAGAPSDSSPSPEASDISPSLEAAEVRAPADAASEAIRSTLVPRARPAGPHTDLALPAATSLTAAPVDRPSGLLPIAPALAAAVVDRPSHSTAPAHAVPVTASSNPASGMATPPDPVPTAAPASQALDLAAPPVRSASATASVDQVPDLLPPAHTSAGTASADQSWPPAQSVAPANAPPAAEASPARLVVVFLPDGPVPTADTPWPLPPGVTVERRSIEGPVSTFAGVVELAHAVGRAVEGDAHGALIVHPEETLAETAWALDLVHEGSTPIVLTAASGTPADLADAVAVAAAGPEGLGCAVVAHGEIHAARHVTATGLAAPAFASPTAGPLGQVIGGTPRLLWRPPERFTVGGPFAGRPPRVGLHMVGLGDDGALVRTLADHCDGLVVASRAGQAALAALAPVLAEPAGRIPIVFSSRTAPPGGLTATGLDPLKARVLMHLLLDAGHDRSAVLDAFAALEGSAARPSLPPSGVATF
jgi:L-asparaginase